MKLKHVLHPTNGIFSNMPATIWGSDLDTELVDIELFTRLGDLDASPLVEHFTQDGILDTPELSRLVHQRYIINWSRMWEALRMEYDIMLTSIQDEERSVLRENSGVETRDLTDTQTGDIENKGTGSNDTVRTGSITRSDNDRITHNTSDTETRSLSTSDKESGRETLTDTFNETNTTDDTTTYSGTETVTDNGGGSEGGTETITKSGSEVTNKKDKETRALKKTINGSIDDKGSVTQTGDGSHNITRSRSGIGNGNMVVETTENDAETRNFTDATGNTKTYNGYTEGDDGTVDHNGSDTTTFDNRRDAKVIDLNTSNNNTNTKTFQGRQDKTSGSDKHTGTVTHATDFGKTVNSTDSGTVTNRRTGTDESDSRGTETYNSLADRATTSENATSTRNLTDKRTGNVTTEGDERVTETFHSEGSSPLRTFQALIHEEIEGRSGQVWNFTDIIIRDVQHVIASKIWRRSHGPF